MTQPITASETLTEADREITKRLHVIAAIHALAQFLADNPDVPTPYEIRATASPGWSTLSDDAFRVAALDKLGEDHDADRYAVGPCEYAQIGIGNVFDHGATVAYCLQTVRKETSRA